MKRIAPLSILLVLASSVALADDTKITTRADAVKAMGDVATLMGTQDATFTRYSDAALKVGGLYTGLDAQTAKLTKLMAQCGPGCSKETRAQLDVALKDTQTMQASAVTQYTQLLGQMQSEKTSYAANSNIMKTKHDTVKNSINNVR